MLTIEHLSVEYYRHSQTVPAVRDLSISLEAGETLGLVGESGSGKSTLALAILRLIRKNEGRISAGKILFDRKELLTLSEEEMRRLRGKQIAMIFQDPFTSLNPVMRIAAQLGEVFAAHGDPWARKDLENALERVQLEPGRILESYPHQLSGGQRQRVMIAMALLGRPKLLLADEPTTALDVLVQKAILDLLFALQKEVGISMIFISHNLGLIAQYARRIAVMKDGQLVEEGISAELFQSPKHPYTQQLLRSLPRFTRGQSAT